MDISTTIDHLRAAREETPAAAATPSTKSKPQECSVNSIRKAKMTEFPVRPVGESEKKKLKK